MDAACPGQHMPGSEEQHRAHLPRSASDGGPRAAVPTTAADGEVAADDQLLIEVNPFETRIAVLGGGELRELHLARSGFDSLVGNVYVGEVQRLAPGLQAAFVDIGLPRPGLLRLDDLGVAAAGSAALGRWRNPPAQPPSDASLHQGQRLLVQVAKDATKSKGVRLTADIGIAGRHLVLTPFDGAVFVSRRLDDPAHTRLKRLAEAALRQRGQDCGCIVRTAALAASEAQLEADLEFLLRRWNDIRRQCPTAVAPTLVHQEMPTLLRAVRDLAGPAVGNIVVDDAPTLHRLCDAARRWLPELSATLRRHDGPTPLFDAYGVEPAIARAVARSVPLPGRGYLVIEHTEAMTTIDVNSGVGDAPSMEDTAFETNRQAAAVIPGQLRLRNIGGIVVVDFIDMAEAAHRDEVLRVLRRAAAADRAPFRASDFSPLGLVEISRRRRRESLLGQVCERCPACAGRGCLKSAQSACYDLLRALRRRYAESAGGEPVEVRVAEAVAARLHGEDAQHLATISQALGRTIRVRADAGHRVDQFDLE